MKKWFKDTETREVQKIPIEFRVLSDGRKGADVPDEEVSFVLCWHDKNDDGFSYQVLFNTIPSFENNVYLILIFDPTEELIFNTRVQSRTIYPPVWDRFAAPIDFLDYPPVMRAINIFMEDKYDQCPFYVDTSPEGKWVSLVADPDFEEKIKKGESYQVVTIKAEAYCEMELKKIEKLEKENENSINQR